jgi:transcription elongation factor Elf1
VNKPESITIICDNEDCGSHYEIAICTLRAADSVTIHCKICGNIMRVYLKDGGIKIVYVK